MKLPVIRSRVLTWVLLAIPLFLAAALAHAANGSVRDQAGFFSDSAKATASRTIAEIEKTLRKDLVIETAEEIPTEVRKGTDLEDKASVRRLFETWSVQRARELRVNGIYILMTRKPAHLQVAVGNETQRQAFTLADRNELTERMLRRLREKKFDEALLAGVGFVQDTLRAHAPAGPRASSPARPAPRFVTPGEAAGGEAGASRSGFTLLGILVPLLAFGVVILVVFALIRMVFGLFRRNSFGGTPPPLGGGGGGGGFIRSMMGGLFGAAAGMWLYNLFSGSHNNALGSDAPSAWGGSNDGFSGRDSDYSSSGGDFGDSSGGGDFGGGGGDFGGSEGGGGGGGDF